MKDDAIEIMFKKIDYNKSGKIEIFELQDLFVKNGMIMSEDEIKTFYESCPTNECGFINFEEFKDLQRNQKIDALYRKYAIRSRQAHEKRFQQGLTNQRVNLPLSFPRFLEQVSFRSRRSEFIRRLEGQYLKKDETVDMMKNFVKLFVIDEGAVLSASTD